MAEQVKFDYSLTAGVISEDEMKAISLKADFAYEK